MLIFSPIIFSAECMVLFLNKLNKTSLSIHTTFSLSIQPSVGTWADPVPWLLTIVNTDVQVSVLCDHWCFYVVSLFAYLFCFVLFSLTFVTIIEEICKSQNTVSKIWTLPRTYLTLPRNIVFSSCFDSFLKVCRSNLFKAKNKDQSRPNKCQFG